MTNNIDAGWAWIVLVACYSGMMLFATTLYSSGVVYVALLDKFMAGETVTSLVGAVSSGLFSMAAPFAGVLVNRLGCRVTVMLGGTLTTIGFVSSVFVPNIECMVLTAGILVGLGYSTFAAGLVCALGYYFNRYRDTVLCVNYLIPGIALFISTPLTLALVQGLGLNGTFFVFGAMVVHICLCGALIRPSKLEVQLHINRKRTNAGVDGTKRKLCKDYLNLSLFKNGPFCLFLLSVTSWCFAFNACVVHFPNYVVKQGGSAQLTGNIMMTLAVGNILGRLLGVLTVYRFKHRSVPVYITVLGVSGIFTALCPLYGYLPAGLYVFAVQFGVSTGLAYSLLTVMALSFTGISRLSEAYGLAFMFSGFGLVSGPIVIGYLYSVTGSYRNTFIASGIALLISSACGSASLCLKQRWGVDKSTELDIQVPLKQGSAIDSGSDIDIQVPLKQGSAIDSGSDIDIHVPLKQGSAIDSPSDINIHVPLKQGSAMDSGSDIDIHVPLKQGSAIDSPSDINIHVPLKQGSAIDSGSDIDIHVPLKQGSAIDSPSDINIHVPLKQGSDIDSGSDIDIQVP